MKKKLLILAAVAVSGLAAVVASNNNKLFGGNEADAHTIEVIDGARVMCCEDSWGRSCDLFCSICVIQCFDYKRVACR